MKSTKCKKHLHFCFWILSWVKYPVCDDLIMQVLGMNLHLHSALKYVDSKNMHFGDAFPSILIEGSGILMKIPKMSLLFMEGENHEKCAANNQRIPDSS